MADDQDSTWRQDFTRSRLVEHEQWYLQGRIGGLSVDPGWRIDLQGRNLRGARVAGLDGARLVDCDLTNSVIGSLHDCELTRCIFSGARLGKLVGATVVGCTFENAMMQVGSFERSSVSECQFNAASLERSDCNQGRLMSSSFREARLTDADLSGGRFEDCDFSGADLRRTVDHLGQTTGSSFVRCDFTDADLDNRPLAGATFERCVFANLRGNPIADRTTRVIDPAVSGPTPAWFSSCSKK